MDSSGPGQGHVTVCCKHGNEPSGSMICGELLEQLRKYHIQQKGAAVRSKSATDQKILKQNKHLKRYTIFKLVYRYVA
jgi:hypothetical protein